MASMRLLRRRRHTDRGAELIELAIVLPILLVVIAAIFDFGFLFQRWEALTNAAREGARIATLPGYTNGDVNARIQSYLTAAGLQPSLAVIQPVAYSTQTLPSGLTVSLVTVEVDYPAGFPNLGTFVGMFGGTRNPLTLRAVSAMRVEAPAAGGS